MSNDKHVIKELVSEVDFRGAFPVLKQLRGHLTLEDYYRLVQTMRNEGYKSFAIYDADKVVAVVGFSILTNLYYGKHMWIYDLVTDEKQRSKNLGEALLSYALDYAKAENCENVALSSGLQREEAHRFYVEKMGFSKVSYVLKMNL